MNYANGTDGDELLQEQGLDLHRYWKILFAKRWMIAGITVAITAVAVAIVLNIPSRYQATASLIFEVDQANPVSVEEIYDLGSQRREYILTQTEMLKSRQLAERVIQRLNLTEHPEFSGSGGVTPMSFITRIFTGPPAENDEIRPIDNHNITTAFLKRLSIEPARNTNLVRVSFDAKSAELAAQVANTLVEEFIRSQSEAKEQFTSRATSWLNERLATLHGKLEFAEQNLQNFREKEDLVDISGVRGLSERELNASTTQLQEMRRDLKQISSVFEQFQALEGNARALANLPEVISNPLIQEIKRNEAAAERNVAELARRYKPKHPDMIAANNELKMVRSQLANEVGILADAIESQYKTAMARVEAQEQEVERTKENYQKVSQKEFRYQELAREVDVNRQLYETFFTRANEAREASGFDIAPVRLVDSAVVPHHPTEPNKKLLVAIAMVMGLAFSTVLALLLDFLHMGVRSPEDVENYLGQRLFGLLPDAARSEDEKLDLRTFFDPDQFAFSEAVRTLLTGVVLAGLGRRMRVIMVTSSVPAEGKTTVAENLAFALSQVENVLLIDADLRRPAIGADFEIDREHPGLTNLIQNTHSLEECVYRDNESNLSVMPSGSYLPNPQRLLVTPRFSEVIKEISEHYDRIIIDTPPVQAVSDALVISQLVDALLYVVKYDAANKRTVARGIGRFTQMGVKIEGVVLTHVDTSKDALYADEYYDYDYGHEPYSHNEQDFECPEPEDLPELNDETTPNASEEDTDTTLDAEQHAETTEEIASSEAGQEGVDSRPDTENIPVVDPEIKSEEELDLDNGVESENEDEIEVETPSKKRKNRRQKRKRAKRTQPI